MVPCPKKIRPPLPYTLLPIKFTSLETRKHLSIRPHWTDGQEEMSGHCRGHLYILVRRWWCWCNAHQAIEHARYFLWVSIWKHLGRSFTCQVTVGQLKFLLRRNYIPWFNGLWLPCLIQTWPIPGCQAHLFLKSQRPSLPAIAYDAVCNMIEKNWPIHWRECVARMLPSGACAMLRHMLGPVFPR